MPLQAIRYSRGKLEILDQLRLPHEEVYISIKHAQDAWHAIKSMQVRGAPAIAIVAALSIAVRVAAVLDLDDSGSSSTMTKGPAATVIDDLNYLITSRPTAVNLTDAATKLKAVVTTAVNTPNADPHAVLTAYLDAAERMLIDDVQDNQRIGQHGANWLLRHTASPGSKVSVITHCNTGSLATAGYGTALGVIRALHSSNALRHVYYTETRPYNQGARLTGYELIHDGIPATLITDSMAAALMNTKAHSENITAIVVGADRVASNGDAANKIGTYALAVLAKYHGIKFLVAAPRTTVDMTTKSGADIEIEERPEIEVVNIKGPILRTNDVSGHKEILQRSTEEMCIAARETRAWNPAFDVTPADLIDGIVTEQGVVEKDDLGVFQWNALFKVGVPDGTFDVGKSKRISMLPDGITPQVPLSDLAPSIQTNSHLSPK
ncbi:MAG: hypothetical protein Q9169_001840 [Polycauliona sp. 2 TL-2023]